MTKTNEIMTNEMPEVELDIVAENVIRETDDFVIFKDEKGKFKRSAKYKNYSSVRPETKEEKIWLFNILDGGEETGAIPLKDIVGSVLEVEDIIFQEYDSVNEDTGEMQYGVLTYLVTPEKQVFVTSGKAVYFTVDKLMSIFGKPTDETWENVKLKVSTVKQARGQQIIVTLVG